MSGELGGKECPALTHKHHVDSPVLAALVFDLGDLDRSDLGAFAALILAGPAPFSGMRIELASDAPTPGQMSADLSDALARPVQFREVPLSSIRSPDMTAMWRFLRGAGYQADIAALRRDYPGVGWTSFAQWTQRTLAASTGHT